MPREGYEIIRTAEGKVLKFNFENSIYNPSIEDDPFVMAQTIGALAESGQVEEIIFSQNEEYVYENLQQIVQIYNDWWKRGRPVE